MSKQIIVQHGSSGLNSPKHAEAYFIIISQVLFSRTGKVMGNVDEGFGVLVQAFPPLVGEHEIERNVIFSELLFAPERWDETATNRIGQRGAFVDQAPHKEVIDDAIERARLHIESGAPPAERVIRRVNASSAKTPDRAHVGVSAHGCTR